MKKSLVDIVNLNADASCLSAARWLDILRGGKQSWLVQYLDLFIQNNKKVSLGIPGATVSDIFQFNPEAIELINDYPEIFEIILRPYAHDIALLRSSLGFQINVEAGIQTLRKTFGKFTPYFLPPEFMLTSEQIFLLDQLEVQGTFILPDRFRAEIRDRIPTIPFRMSGMFASQMNALVFEPKLTQKYLHSLHNYSAVEWNKHILFSEREVVFSWRDGESSFFIPDGKMREALWLKNENEHIERKFLSEILEELDFAKTEDLPENNFHHYPVHSFSAWMKEFRMLGFIQHLQKEEERLEGMSNLEKAVWLQTINSDILSAVEKDSPRIQIKLDCIDDEMIPYTIWRSERNFEGQEFLNILLNMEKDFTQKYLYKNNQPHIQKLRSRIQFINEQEIFINPSHHFSKS